MKTRHYVTVSMDLQQAKVVLRILGIVADSGPGLWTNAECRRVNSVCRALAAAVKCNEKSLGRNETEKGPT